jgi:hypothetical protein
MQECYIKAFIHLASMLVACYMAWMNPSGTAAFAVPVSSASHVPALVFSEVQAGAGTATPPT